jgi:putative hydrolase of the HAD superfamily
VSVRAVVFDYYFTLADPEVATVDREALTAWRARKVPDVDRDPARFVLLGERWEHHGGASWRASREADHASAVAYDDVEQMLATLRALDLRVAVLSDADCSWLHESISRNGFELDAVVCSEDVRCYKPHAAPFLAVCDALGVAPAETAYVGDTPRLDVVGSRDAGMTAVWLNRRNLVWPTDVEPPAHSISSLAELALVVRG